MNKLIVTALLILGLTASTVVAVHAQEVLPMDSVESDYHAAPRYRESESHPLRLIAYILHPIGWVAREVFFRPLSYFASSSETRRSVLGYREPYDYRRPDCFSSDDTVPDCRVLPPYNYAANGAEAIELPAPSTSNER